MTYILNSCTAASLFSLRNCNDKEWNRAYKLKIWAVSLKIDGNYSGELQGYQKLTDKLWISIIFVNFKEHVHIQGFVFFYNHSEMKLHGRHTCCAERLRCHSIWMHLIYTVFSCEKHLQDKVCEPFVIKWY